jgi:hypothetical protein
MDRVRIICMAEQVAQGSGMGKLEDAWEFGSLGGCAVRYLSSGGTIMQRMLSYISSVIEQTVVVVMAVGWSIMRSNPF